MRKPPITFDAILTALAVLSTTTACSKAERAAAEPAAATPAATATGSAAPPIAAQPPEPAPSAAPTAAPTAASPGDETGNARKAMVDAGAERKPAAGPAPTKGGSAACGATGCSAEMRKGGK